METARATYIVSFKTSLQKPTGDVMDPTSILYAVNSWNTQPKPGIDDCIEFPFFFSSSFFVLFCRPLLVCSVVITGEKVHAVQMLFSPSAYLGVQHQLFL